MGCSLDAKSSTRQRIHRECSKGNEFDHLGRSARLRQLHFMKAKWKPRMPDNGPPWLAHKVGFFVRSLENPVFEDGRRGRLDRLVCAVKEKRPRYSSLRAFLFDRRLYASSLNVSQGLLVGWGAPGVGVGRSKHLPTASSADGCLPCSLPRSCAPGFEWRR
jgi:hypothetical protein